MTHVHLVGIGGTGLSAIARVLLESGYTVSGSDMVDSALAQSVQEAGARVTVGHSPENIAGADLVVRFSAIPDTNVEVQQAFQVGIPVLKRADFLSQLMQDQQVVAVAGAHGKTTTTAMIAWILFALGQDPSFIVGGVVRNLDTNARSGSGPVFVIEADEYDRMFLGLRPDIAVITNVEYDHPDIYLTPEEFQQAFRDFSGCVGPAGLLIVCGDDPGAQDIAQYAALQGLDTRAYAIDSPGAVVRAENIIPIPGSGYQFDLHLPDRSQVLSINLQVPGRYNVLNALGALAVADHLGLRLEAAAAALSQFSGTGRRFDELGEAGGVLVINDYAHHPTEIRATLTAARERYPDRELWVVWQPHTYSRTKALFDAFAASFANADHVVVPEVYRSREPVDPGFSSQQVIQAMKHPDAYYVSDWMDIPGFLQGRLKPDDVLLVLSAGDADQISKQVYENLSLAG